jgi:hypothetical protein
MPSRSEHRAFAMRAKIVRQISRQDSIVAAAGQPARLQHGRRTSTSALPGDYEATVASCCRVSYRVLANRGPLWIIPRWLHGSGLNLRKMAPFLASVETEMFQRLTLWSNLRKIGRFDRKNQLCD